MTRGRAAGWEMLPDNVATFSMLLKGICVLFSFIWCQIVELLWLLAEYYHKYTDYNSTLSLCDYVCFDISFAFEACHGCHKEFHGSECDVLYLM